MLRDLVVKMIALVVILIHLVVKFRALVVKGYFFHKKLPISRCYLKLHGLFFVCLSRKMSLVVIMFILVVISAPLVVKFRALVVKGYFFHIKPPNSRSYLKLL